MARRLGDSKFYQAWSLAADLVIVNLLLVATSLPIVTFGAALTAGLAFSLRTINGTAGRTVADFFTTFRHAFVPATLVWLADLALGALLLWEWAVSGHLASSTLMMVFRAVIMLGGLIVVFVNIWFWPLLARGIIDGRAVGLADVVPLLRSALLSAFKLLPRTLAATALVVAPLALAASSPEVGARMIFWFMIIGIALPGYLIALLLRTPLGIELLTTDD